MAKELTPWQEAKQRRETYIKLIIDQRRTDKGGGRIEVEGPVSEKQAKMARSLWAAIVADQGPRP